MMPVGKMIGRLTGSRPMEAPLTVDEAGTVLANERRRMVVYGLAEADEEKMTLGNVSELIASSEHEKPPRLLESHERKQVYVALYQSHLPKLDNVGVINYDKDRGTFTYGPAFNTILRVLNAVEDVQDGVIPGNGPAATLLSKLPTFGQVEFPLTVDEVGVVVGNERRRLVIDAIGQADDGIQIGDLAEIVASAEYETPPGQLDKQQERRVWISCHQTHLPRLESMDIITYDPDADDSMVRRGPAFEHARRAIKAVRSECGGDNRGELA